MGGSVGCKECCQSAREAVELLVSEGRVGRREPFRLSLRHLLVSCPTTTQIIEILHSNVLDIYCIKVPLLSLALATKP